VKVLAAMFVSSSLSLEYAVNVNGCAGLAGKPLAVRANTIA